MKLSLQKNSYHLLVRCTFVIHHWGSLSSKLPTVHGGFCSARFDLLCSSPAAFQHISSTDTRCCFYPFGCVGNWISACFSFQQNSLLAQIWDSAAQEQAVYFWCWIRVFKVMPPFVSADSSLSCFLSNLLTKVRWYYLLSWCSPVYFCNPSPQNAFI